MLTSNTDPMDIDPREAGTLFENIDTEEFDSTLHYFFNGRAGFCKFLGIRESTLSGWLKDKNLPYYAKVAFGLAVAFDNLKTKYRSHTNEINLPVVVNLGEQWGLMEIQKDVDGTSTGKLLASGITSEKDAKRIQASIKGANLFVKSMPQIFSGFCGHSLDYDTYYEEHDESNDKYDKYQSKNGENFAMTLFHSGTEVAEKLGLSKSLIDGLKNESMGGFDETPLVNIALKILEQYSTPKETKHT